MANKNPSKNRSMKPFVDGPETALEEILVAEPMPHIDLKDIDMYESMDEVADANAPIAEPTDEAATEKTYMAISKERAITEESKKGPCMGTGSILQQPREW
jgi:hypothetical protein